MHCDSCEKDLPDAQARGPHDESVTLCWLCLTFELGRARGYRTARETPTDRDFDWLGDYVTGDDPSGCLTDPQTALAFAGGMHKGAREATEEGDPFPG